MLVISIFASLILSAGAFFYMYNELSERNVIQRLDHLESARNDSITEPQGHFICEICGEIDGRCGFASGSFNFVLRIGKILWINSKLSRAAFTSVNGPKYLSPLSLTFLVKNTIG